MRQETKSSLVQIKACHLISTKPLSEPILDSISLFWTLGTNCSEIVSESHTFSFKKMLNESIPIGWLQWVTQIARFMGPTWGPPGSCRPQMGPILAPWTLLSGGGGGTTMATWTATGYCCSTRCMYLTIAVLLFNHGCLHSSKWCPK